MSGFVNRGQESQDWDCQTCGAVTPCEECVLHGPLVAGRHGINHSIAWHEDGTGHAVPPSPAVRLRKPIELRGGRDGGVIPARGGKRRAEIVRELAPFLPMVDSDRRGPDGVPIATVASRVDRLMEEGGLDRDAAFDSAAKEFHWARETIRSRYWRYKGERRRAATDDAAPDAIPWAEILAELDLLRQSRRRTNLPLVPYAVPFEDIVAVAMIIRDRHGFSVDLAAKLVALVVDWPVPAIGSVLKACREAAAEEDDPSNEKAFDEVILAELDRLRRWLPVPENGGPGVVVPWAHLKSLIDLLRQGYHVNCDEAHRRVNTAFNRNRQRVLSSIVGAVTAGD